MALQEKKVASSIPLSSLPAEEVDLERRRRARRGLLIYFLLLVPLSALFEGLMITTQNMFCVVFLMWTPTLASGVSRMLMREGFADISFRLGGRRTIKAIGIAIFVPPGIGLVAYGVAWVTGVTPFVPFHASENLSIFLSFAGNTAIPGTVLLALLYLTVIEVFTATGEEIGWRGYMLTRLIDAGIPKPVLVSGLIWSFWHWPLILLAPPVAGLPQVVTACIFLVTITSLGCISARLRLETGSIWPSIFLHATWNSALVEIYDGFTRGSETSLWTGESGILVAVTMVVVAFFFARGVWKVLHVPEG